MNTSEAILLSALINIIIAGLISGIAIYRIQKKIDASYQKQMEEFKASLDRLNFEYQVKFSRKVPKTLEVLENIYQKFIESTFAFDRFTDDIAYYVYEFDNDSEKAGDFWTSKEILASKCNQINEYFENNRIFVTDESIEAVSSVLKTGNELIKLISFKALYDDPRPLGITNFINNNIKGKKLDVRLLDTEERTKSELYGFLLEVYFKYKDLSPILEHHYKSILDK
jgi:hypothetical protein